MSSFPDTSIIDASMPVPQAASAIIARLQNEISPERIARRIGDMLEATSTGPGGAECPDWRTIEAGVKLYLAFLHPGTVDGCSPPAAQAGSRAANGVAPLPVLNDAARVVVVPAGMQAQQQQPVARELPRRKPEPLEIMRRMMVLEPDTLSSKRDTDGRPIPRPDPLVRKDKHLSVFKLVTFRKSRWLAMLAGCVAVVWMAGNTLRQPASAQPGEQQVSTPRQMSPAVAAQPPQKEELKTWFLEDIQTEVNVTRGKLLQ